MPAAKTAAQVKNRLLFDQCDDLTIIRETALLFLGKDVPAIHAYLVDTTAAGHQFNLSLCAKSVS